MTAHILFVDDDESNLIVWETACSDEFRVLTATRASRALELLAENEVAVIVTDQRMPEVTGIELLERVRVDFPHVVRILITAYSDLAAAVDAINRGNVRRYLRKPCALHELRSELTSALEYYELRMRVRSMERRLLFTERVYALGLVASGLGRELVRPAAWIRESVTMARTEVRAVVEKLDARETDTRLLRTKLADLETRLGFALEGVERVVSIANSIGLPATDAVTEDVDLADVIRVVLRIVRGEIRQRAEIELDVGAVPPVRGSGTKLSQVVLNLMVNAIHAVGERPSGGGLVSVRLYVDARNVRLEVSDNGPQIPPEDLPHLFDPFHASRTPRGTGIGLAISKTIIEEMGGFVEAANHPRGGAFFRVTLPIGKAPLS